MKWIVYLLLLANISFFAWHYQSVGRDEQRTQAEQSRSDATVRLVMLNEMKSRVADEAKAPSRQCRSLGPFKKRKQAEQVESLLQKQGDTVNLRVSNEAKRKGYWVYLSPVANHEAARKQARKLKKKHGIKDIFIVGTGEKKNGISLGVFSKFELAYRRQSEIRKLGFDAQLSDVKLPIKEYWLDWPQAAVTELAAEQLGAVKKINNSVSVVKSVCQP